MILGINMDRLNIAQLVQEKDFPKLLAEIQESTGWNNQRIAAELGTTGPNITRWKSGNTPNYLNGDRIVVLHQIVVRDTKAA